VGKLSGPTVLITTDGDRTIPSDLPRETVKAIVEDANVLRWYSQNLEYPPLHPKMYPIPIGLDLHSRSIGSSGTRTKVRQFRNAIQESKATVQRTFRVWSDVHVEQDLGSMREDFPDDLGKPGARFYRKRLELGEAIMAGELNQFVDSPTRRLPQEQIWTKYGTYFFVISLPGHGLDCHRTWEALALGATVVTISTPLDAMLENFRVVILDADNPKWWSPLNNQDWLRASAKELEDRPPADLTWSSWVSSIQQCFR